MWGDTCRHFELHLPDDSYVEYLFMYLLGILLSFRNNVYSGTLIHFESHYYYRYWVIWVLHVLGILTFYQIMICKYFLPFTSLPFHLLTIPLLCRSCWFDVVQLVYFYWCFSGFVVRFKKLLPRSVSRNLLPMLF